MKIAQALAVLILITSVGLLLSKPASAQVLDDICKDTPQASICQDNQVTQSTSSNSIYGPNGVLTKAASIIAIIVGIVSLFVMIIGGVSYALSGGDSSKTNTARNTVIYAAVGLVVAALAQSIIIFVVKKL